MEVKIETDSNDAVKIKTEADSNDITECSYVDHSSTGMFSFSDTVFSTFICLELVPLVENSKSTIVLNYH